ncbi:hypothetical protein OAK91_00200 [Planctomycetaceae bacterium]|jgi:uncharacterized membrane protein|nr:hypothetical protein [Planctomycetaceae bacterium]
MNTNLITFFKESYLQWIALIFAISLLIWGAMRIRAYFLEESDTTDDNHKLLKQLREMKTEGEIADEEYRKLKSRINLEHNTDSERDSNTV